MNSLLPLLTIDIEATVKPAGSHPELVDAGDKNDLPFHLTEADLAPRRVAPVNDFSAIPGDSELRDLARVTPDEFRN